MTFIWRNDIWRYFYLVIGCLDWKISIFQQTVVRVYYILDAFPSYTLFLELSFDIDFGENAIDFIISIF